MIGHVQRMRQMALLISICSSDPESHWRDHFGSLPLPLAFDESRHSLHSAYNRPLDQGTETNNNGFGIYHTTHSAL